MKSSKWLIIMIPVILLSGCWSKIEVDEQIFVFAIYVDVGQEPGTVEVTISSPLPNRMMAGQQAGSSGANGKSYAMVSKTDVTIPDAVRQIQKDLTRRINFGHTREIIVGRDYAESGIGDLLDWISKEHSFHISAFLATAPHKAKDIAELTPLYEQMPAEVLRKMNLQRTMFSTSVKEALLAYSSNVGFGTNYMSIGFETMPGENEKMQKWAGIQGAALYQRDKMTGTLDAPEARAVAWATGRLGRQVFSVTWDEGKSRGGVLLDQLKATRKVKMTERGPQFTIHLEATGNLIYSKDMKRRSDTERTLMIAKLLASKIEKDLNSAIRLTKKYGSDTLKLGLLLEWNYPQYWNKVREDWPDYYKTQSDIQVKAKVDVTHITNQP
ncbi:Ger(x)C family spore germination protein [Paenibacillus sp. FJAT-26967]|uniref:Ger(x)C family spore germination protein n=1 Tax=Paenibacillus sp. FJAT-26967 TaxID=1729690 RepID=UPI000AD734B6|nr:Ger(x)C family spore germination protein [Paenibacillus sp. FJAT-26967]